MNPVLTVSELNREVKTLLDSAFGLISVTGELSNLSKPYSGHWYFTLKDAHAQIKCAFFKQYHRGLLSDSYQDGTQVIITGRLGLYEPRGDYQLIIHTIEEAGIGALYKQFELLKKKLALEGMFDALHKKRLPAWPQTIGIITSRHAAALRDILITLSRRYPLADIILYPSEVQGQTAPQQLCQAINQACLEQKADVLILARGGGNLEDLWAFNNEQLARTMFQATIPIVTGVGHETDTTIADFVADYRAATPTAAAVAATPDQHHLSSQLQQTQLRLVQYLTRIFQHQQMLHKHLSFRLQHQIPLLMNQTETLNYLIHRLKKAGPALIQQQQQRHDLYCRALATLNPLDILHRGFAVVTQGGVLIKHVEQASVDLPIEIQLVDGKLRCQLLS
ncbi:MAG: exodeoxyribonuclease VII large subunit [Gammaproteobacteria bacterium]|nr:exodeoxyribonuclease VII large subunit [Gammaproteobacteria bacterium]